MGHGAWDCPVYLINLQFAVTTDPETRLSNSNSFVKTNLKGKLKKIVGNLYGLRTWVEYGFRQGKQELG